MTSRSPRRQAPAGRRTLASRGIGWFAMARRAKRSRSGAASMKRCAAPRGHEAQALDEPEGPDDEHRHEGRRDREEQREPLHRGHQVVAHLLDLEPTPAADRNGVATRSSSSGRSSTLSPALVIVPRKLTPHRRGRAPARRAPSCVSWTRWATRTQSTTQRTMPTSATTWASASGGDVAVQLHGGSLPSSGRTAAGV